MFKGKLHILFETIGTVAWLLMDYCWMSGYEFACDAFGMIAIWFLFLAFASFKGNKVSESLSYCTSMLWCTMNFFWMISDFTKLAHMLYIAKGIFIIASILLVATLVNSLLEKKLTEIKRFKVK